MKTLEEILEKEKSHRQEEGIFGIKACKESILNTIKFDKEFLNKETSLEELLDGYVERANASIFFNQAMVLACWELINEKKQTKEMR